MLTVPEPEPEPERSRCGGRLLFSHQARLPWQPRRHIGLGRTEPGAGYGGARSGLVLGPELEMLLGRGLKLLLG